MTHVSRFTWTPQILNRIAMSVGAGFAIGSLWLTHANSQTTNGVATSPATVESHAAADPVATAATTATPVATVVRTDELDMQQRQEYLEGLTVDHKAKLQAKRERFNQLAPEEQQRLRELHQAIVQHKHRDQLETVLENYTNWLATLTPNERYEVQSLAQPAEKLAEINKLRSRQEDLRLARVGLTKVDAQTTWDWFDRMLKVHRDDVIAGTRDGKRGGDQQPINQFLAGFVCSNPRGMSALQSALTRDDKDQLLQRLSATAVDKYASTPSPDQQKLIADWIHESARSQFQQVSEEQIKRRLSRLPEEERERYLAMPRHKIFEELRRREQMRSPRGPRNWRSNGGGPRSGGFPGSRNGDPDHPGSPNGGRPDGGPLDEGPPDGPPPADHVPPPESNPPDDPAAP